jgi:hypothetical protein
MKLLTVGQICISDKTGLLLKYFDGTADNFNVGCGKPKCMCCGIY